MTSSSKAPRLGLRLATAFALTVTVLPGEDISDTVAVRGEVVHATVLELLGLSFRDVVAHPELDGGVLTLRRCEARGYGGTVQGTLRIITDRVVARHLRSPTQSASAASARASTAASASAATQSSTETTHREDPRLAAEAFVADAMSAPDFLAQLDHRMLNESTSLLAGSFSVEAVNLATFLRSFGGSASVEGTVKGWASCALPVGKPEHLFGRGEIEISDASLVAVPFLLNFLVGDPRANRGKDRAIVRFELAGSQVRILSAEIHSPVLDALMSGTVHLDGTLDLRLNVSTSGGILREIVPLRKLLSPLVRRLTDTLSNFSLRGRISDPVLVYTPFAD